MNPALRSLRLLAPAFAALLMAPAAGHAAPSAAFELNTPSPCYAGQCRTGAYYDSSRLPHQVTIEVDWEHQGAPDVGFVADDRLVCGQVLPAPAVGPYVAPVDYVPCQLFSPTLRTPGTSSVALRLTDADGSAAYAAQPLEVVQLPARKPSARDRIPSRTEDAAGGGYSLCASTPAGVKCQAGGGRRTVGGGEKVSHKGWPQIDGVFWMVENSSGRSKAGGPDNDELLGHHGSDTLKGMGGKDVLWGDWDPANNNTRQRDILIGGAGNDFIYPSHGTTSVDAGPGKDYIWAFYGKGTIDCGAGYDTVRVRLNGAFKLRNCEKVGHFCQFGPDGNGGCKKPGEAALPRRDAAGAASSRW